MKLLWIQGDVIKMSSGFSQPQTHRENYKARGGACLFDKHKLGITVTMGLITSSLYASLLPPYPNPIFVNFN